MLTKRRKNITAENAEGAEEYNREPTADELNRLVYLAAQHVKYSGGYDSLQSVASDVVKNDAYMDLASPMANLTTVNALDVPGAVVWTDAADQNGQATNEPTQQGNNAANQNTQQNSNATGNNTQNRPEAEQPGDNGEKPTIDISTDGFEQDELQIMSPIEDLEQVFGAGQINEPEITEASSAEALQSAKDKIDSIGKDDLPSETKKMIKTLINKLKSIASSTTGNLTVEDKKKLSVMISRKLTSLFKGKVKYKQKDTFNQITGEPTGNSSYVCVQHNVIVAYIMGLTRHSDNGHIDSDYSWISGHNAWHYIPSLYDYNDAYDKATPAMKEADKYMGVTSFANNEDLCKKRTDVNGAKIAKWLNNPTKYKDKLNSLKGTQFFSRKISNNRDYEVYSHTGIITGYDPVKKVLIVDDSTRDKTGTRNGVGVSEYDISTIKKFKAFHVYEFNFGENQ